MFCMFRLVVRYEHEIKEHRMGWASETFAVKAELVFAFSLFVECCGLHLPEALVAIFSLGL